ncbi:hypothetical protein [Trichloromonas sp.]|uniref:hypothetical protein n=1 Tax=Trichloromonas sp. TaxID=3069249 RepID=UPI002A3F6DEE|nr:hypothetical protein [Trichloromonas sp.]
MSLSPRIRLIDNEQRSWPNRLARNLPFFKTSKINHIHLNSQGENTLSRKSRLTLLNEAEKIGPFFEQKKTAHAHSASSAHTAKAAQKNERIESEASQGRHKA